ncbi:MAG: GNAT family N-acetyltransferase [Armatimonadota bacterium]
MTWGPNAPAETRDFIERKLAEQSEQHRRVYDLAVTDRASGELLGSVGLRLNAEGTQAALGYCYARQAWGRGIATEAAREMLRFGFEKLGLHRIHATCDTDNVASARVLEKLGMRREGRFVEDVWQRGHWRDTFSYAILRREWATSTAPGGAATGSESPAKRDDAERAIRLFQAERADGWEGAQLQIPEGVEVRMQVPYGTGGAQLTTDLFLPPRERFEGPRPAILYIHGGGWRAGSPTQFYRHAARLADRGIVGSCCRYRFAPEFPFPAAVHDVKAAVRWLRASADEYAIDTERIGVLGGSAGGHLAGVVATTAGVPELEGDGGHAGQRSDVQLAVLLNPITDMTQFAEDDPLREAVEQFMGGPSEEMAAAYRLASPLLQIDDDTPPCLLVHGGDDRTVPPEQSERFAEAMRGRGLRAELICVPDVGHGFFNSDPHYESIYQQIEAFVLDVLRPETIRS